MIEKRLVEQLQQVGQRYASFRFWSTMTVTWAVLTLIAACLLSQKSQITWSPASVLNGLAVAAFTCTALAAWIAQRNKRNYLKLAQQVENQFPELEARLMTAVQQEPSLPGGHYGFLQQQVIRETLAHGRKQPWTQIISRRRIAITHCSHVFAATCFLGTMLLWTQVPGETAGQTAVSNSPEAPV
ncbi:MAG: hypothetical protein GY917_18515, partial [Planctomycetaceae bacterium]|nr:hypothetical protein [Planctomycetaceae bacterium]